VPPLWDKSYPTETTKGQAVEYTFGQGGVLIVQEWNRQVLQTEKYQRRHILGFGSLLQSFIKSNS